VGPGFFELITRESPPLRDGAMSPTADVARAARPAASRFVSTAVRGQHPAIPGNVATTGDAAGLAARATS